MAPFLPSLGARDLLVTGVNIVDVVTQTVYPGWFTVWEGRFIEVEAGELTDADLAGLTIAEQRDLGGAFVQPGMLDVHMHIESSLVTPASFAAAALPHGTTTILQDPHEVANVQGAEGIRRMIEASQGLPLRVYSAISSCVPATSSDIETPNATLHAADVTALAQEPGVLALGEVMDYRGLVAGRGPLREIVAAAKGSGLAMEGHVPSLTGAPLSRYVAHGIRSDHTLASPEKLVEELRKGLWVMIQEKSLTAEVVAQIAALPDRSRLLLITDDVMPDRLTTGHMSRLVTLAGERGWPLLDALASATLRPATYLGLTDLGIIAPGANADFVVTAALCSYPPTEVHVAGRLVARDGKTVVPCESRHVTWGAPLDIHTENLNAHALGFGGPERVHGRHTVTARVIRTNRVNSFTTLETRVVELQDGVPTDPDVALACVVPRARLAQGAGSYVPVVCLVAGTGLSEGGYASSFSHDSHNVFLFGRDLDAMFRSLRAIAGSAGGMAFTARDHTTLLPLPIAGLLSDAPVPEVALAFEELEAAIVAAGMNVRTPVLLLTLLALSVSPDFKVSDLGIVDVQARRVLTPEVTADA